MKVRDNLQRNYARLEPAALRFNDLGQHPHVFRTGSLESRQLIAVLRESIRATCEEYCRNCNYFLNKC